MKNLMFMSITVMCLSITLLVGIHIGEQKAEAQGMGTIVAGWSCEYAPNVGQWFLADNGDVYWDHYQPPFDPVYKGNVFSGPVNIEATTWGQLKQRYVEDK